MPSGQVTASTQGQRTSLTANSRNALAPIDRHALPDRSYYLTAGPVTTATDLRYPGDDGWRNLDLFWPDDRQWFIATDVDFW